MTLTFLIVAMLLLAAGQVLQKLGAERHLGEAHTPRHWFRGLLCAELLSAAACLGAGTLAWLFVLYRTDVSRAFPILSIGSVVVLAASQFYLQERVSRLRWVGGILIAVGVALVSAS